MENYMHISTCLHEVESYPEDVHWDFNNSFLSSSILSDFYFHVLFHLDRNFTTNIQQFYKNSKAT